MARLILARLGAAVLVVLGVSVLVFLLLHLVPGDPVETMLGQGARPADHAALTHALGLDRPLWVQLLEFLRRVFTLQLGDSILQQRPIGALLAERLPATVELALAALAVAVLVALPLGIVAALRRGSVWDRLATGFALFGVSIPNFWMGPLLILLFSLQLGWLPVSGREGPASLVLPALTLGTSLAAVLSRMVRSSLLEVLGEDFMRTARAKGLSELQVVLRHGLRNALLPLITVLGLQLGVLLGGAVVTETVFAWPGVGLLTIEAIQRRDYPVVQACVLLISVGYVVVNLLLELVYAWADPRIGSGR